MAPHCHLPITGKVVRIIALEALLSGQQQQQQQQHCRHRVAVPTGFRITSR